MGDPVPFFELLFPAHPQGLGSDFLEIPLGREEEGAGIIRHFLLGLGGGLPDLGGVEEEAAAGLAEFRGHIPQLQMCIRDRV